MRASLAAIAGDRIVQDLIDAGSLILTEEALAYLVGDKGNADLPLFRRILAAVRAFLTRAGFKLDLTTDDLVLLAQSALETAAQREVRAGAITKGVLGRNEEDAEAARQYAEVVARYTNPDGSKKDGWMKAPNGQPTKLNERQWVQVRTPNFIAWFGDWEYVAHQQAIDAIFPVEAVALSGKSLQEINRNVLNYVDSRYLHGEARQFENLETHDQIMVSKTALRKAMSGHAGEQKMWAATVVPDLLRVAHKVFTTNDNKGRPDIKAYHYYVTPVKIDGKIYYAKLVVRELTDGHKFYDHELSEVSEGPDSMGPRQRRWAPNLLPLRLIILSITAGKSSTATRRAWWTPTASRWWCGMGRMRDRTLLFSILIRFFQTPRVMQKITVRKFIPGSCR